MSGARKEPLEGALYSFHQTGFERTSETSSSSRKRSCINLRPFNEHCQSKLIVHGPHTEDYNLQCWHYLHATECTKIMITQQIRVDLWFESRDIAISSASAVASKSFELKLWKAISLNIVLGLFSYLVITSSIDRYPNKSCLYATSIYC